MYACKKVLFFITLISSSTILCTPEINERITLYHSISDYLALLSNEEIEKILANATHIRKGAIHGNSGCIDAKDTKIFFKKIHLTCLEKKAENILSTKNIFGLPPYYQYGIGSAGFGAWRELHCHMLTTDWVITNMCPHFPLLYHWRILPHSTSLSTNTTDIQLKEQLKEYTANWNHSSAIKKRMKALHQATDCIVLFLEYIPHTLNNKLRNQRFKREIKTKRILIMIEKDLFLITHFMKTHGMIHFDAHLNNILTDGIRLYFTDFGLSSVDTFSLSEEEKTFFKSHNNFDFYVAILNLVKILTLINYKIQSPSISSFVKKYFPMAKIMNTFFKQIDKNKMTPFPSLELKNLTVKQKL